MEQNLFPIENSIQEWSAKIIVRTLEESIQKKKIFQRKRFNFHMFIYIRVYVYMKQTVYVFPLIIRIV